MSNKSNTLFFAQADDYIYNRPVDVLQGEYIYCPLEVDTEFTHAELIDNQVQNFKCTNITVQMRSINSEKAVIYSYEDIADVARHKTIKNEIALLDYLVEQGYNVDFCKTKLNADYPIFQFDIYTFFGIAEIARIFQGEYRKDIINLITNPKSAGIEQGRRLRTYTQCGNNYFNWVEIPNWCLTINGRKFRVRLSIYDTCAVHGNADYASFCSNSGVKLKYKDNFTNKQKAKMDVMYLEHPEEFDNYALGDLYNYDALRGNMGNFELIYKSLGLEKYFQPPKLTIGSTVSKILESAIKNLFGVGIDDKDIISRYCKYGSADWLKRKTSYTGCLNAKVDGGRCRNNRPIDTFKHGVLCDIDISGCYGEGLRVQTYPLGIPVVIDYPVQSERNKYQTLRQFLKKYGKELVPGLWQARVSLKEDYQLNHKQDYLVSWFPPKDISKMTTDTEFNETDQWWTVDNVGEIKILTNEVNNAIITHDFIQWLDNVASVRQRKELLDNLLIKTAMFYPASERVNSVYELQDKHRNHNGVNTTEARKYKKTTRKISIEHECHAWYGVNLGELFVDKLLLERKKYKKKTPLNNLYKLCINTVYGDMVSPFFKVGNVVVGNNITARARALAWCMEKGLHGWQSITDGCVFDINRILYPRYNRKINGEVVVGLYADDKQQNYQFGTLTLAKDQVDTGFLKPVEVYKDRKTNKPALIAYDSVYSGEHLSVEESLEWINVSAMKHLQYLFPNLDILHQETKNVYGHSRIGQFDFEVKGFYDKASFHGSANYSLHWNGETDYKMRSYSRKRLPLKAEIVNNEIVLSDDYEPSKEFLQRLYKPNQLKRSDVYIKNRILKVGDFRNNYQKWKDTDVYPGCSVEMSGILHEFSLSQFTFCTYKQYTTWKKEYERFLRKYGQSYEMFFINDDGTLDYQRMVETVDKLIRSGAKSFFSGCDKREKHTYRNYKQHSNQECVERVRNLLEVRYGGYDFCDSVYSDESPMRIRD